MLIIIILVIMNGCKDGMRVVPNQKQTEAVTKQKKRLKKHGYQYYKMAIREMRQEVCV